MARLNISCTCAQCTTFLHPLHSPSSATHVAPSRLSAKIVVAAAPQHPWKDKLSLSTYQQHHQVEQLHSTHASISPSPLHSLRVATSIVLPSPSFPAGTNRSPSTTFPATPGALRCSYRACRARVPRGTRLAVGDHDCMPLCEEHSSEVLFDAKEQLGELNTEAMLGTARNKMASRLSEPSIKAALDGTPDGMARPSPRRFSNIMETWGSLGFCGAAEDPESSSTYAAEMGYPCRRGQVVE